MKTIFVETGQFNQMISYKPYTETRHEKKKVKYSLLDRIKDRIGDRWNLFKEGTRQTFDMICFFSAELGFFYAGDEYLATRHNISSKTVRIRFKELEELGQVIKVYRRAKRCNGRGKPIYLFVNHPYFNYWVDLLGLNLADFHTDFQTENAEIPSESKEKQPKKVSTYSLPSLKNKNIIKRKMQRLDSSFTASYVPKEFVQAVKPFFDDAATIEDFWKSVFLDTRNITNIVDPETITYTAIDAFKQSIRGYKRGKVKTSLVRYFTGTFKKRMDQAYFDLPLSF